MAARLTASDRDTFATLTVSGTTIVRIKKANGKELSVTVRKSDVFADAKAKGAVAVYVGAGKGSFGWQTV